MLGIWEIELQALVPKYNRYPKQIITLGDQLKCNRLDWLKPVEQVCRDLKVPSSTLNRWESNRVKPNPESEEKVKDI